MPGRDTVTSGISSWAVCAPAVTDGVQYSRLFPCFPSTTLLLSLKLIMKGKQANAYDWGVDGQKVSIS